eukprot:9499387-Pyramimonas_sp.AAC.1
MAVSVCKSPEFANHACRSQTRALHVCAWCARWSAKDTRGSTGQYFTSQARAFTTAGTYLAGVLTCSACLQVLRFSHTA